MFSLRKKCRNRKKKSDKILFTQVMGQLSGGRFLGYCSLAMSREVFFVSEGHRKPETYCATLCD